MFPAARHRTGTRWTFAHDPHVDPLLLPFGVRTDDDAYVELDDERLSIRFGHWTLSTPARNIRDAQVTGPFVAAKVLGTRLSLADRGITFGTATERGACIRFHLPVPAIEPLALLRHPGVTVTVDDPESLVDEVRRRVAADPTNGFRDGGPPPGPSLPERAGRMLTYPWGMARTAAKYLRNTARVERTETGADASDLPPDLPQDVLDADLKTFDDGHGPLLHRTFEVRIAGSRASAADLMDVVTEDLDRAAPSEVATFQKERGRIGEMRVGDEYRVRMPAPWDGPVRVVHRDATSFRFATLSRHLEAGQIEFRARDTADGLRFGIEVWSRPGDRGAAIVIDRIGIGKEIQLHMWVHFCLSAVDLAGGRPDGPVRVHTRRAELPLQDV